MKGNGKLWPILADSDSRYITVKGDEVLDVVTLRSQLERRFSVDEIHEWKTFYLWTRELNDVNISPSGGKKNNSWLGGMPTDRCDLPLSCDAGDNPPFANSLSNLMQLRELMGEYELIK